MPRCVRNFWVEVDGGNARPIATGPRAKDGGIDVRIYVRDDGSVSGPVRICGRVSSSGDLILEALRLDGGAWIPLAETKR
jgi:hypothetical protein